MSALLPHFEPTELQIVKLPRHCIEGDLAVKSRGQRSS